MCRSMADIQSTAAEIRRGKKKKKIEDRRRRRKKLQGKNIMAPLLHRAAIKSHLQLFVWGIPSSREICRVERCVWGWFSWLYARSPTASTFSVVHVVRRRPLPGARSMDPVVPNRFWKSSIDPSAAPPSVFRLARTKSGWRADPCWPKFGWRRRQTFLAATAAGFGASS